MRTHAVQTASACFVVYVIWGTTYPAIALMLAPPHGQGLPPFLATGGRLVLAGVALLVLGQFSAQGRAATRSLTLRQFAASTSAGLFLCFGTAALVAGASQRLPSGAVANYLATAPMWAVLMSSAATKSLPRTRVFTGLGLGLAGVVVLSGSAVAPDALGVFLALSAAAAWAFGSWYTSVTTQFPRHICISGGISQLTSGGALVAIGLMRSEVVDLPPLHTSAASLLALAYLTCVSVAGLTTYSWLLTHRNSLVATTHAFVNPIVAAGFGALLLNEGLPLRLLVSAAMVGGGAFWAMSSMRGPRGI
jgi:drug/metabolite transporter (DMT)-like permease